MAKRSTVVLFAFELLVSKRPPPSSTTRAKAMGENGEKQKKFFFFSHEVFPATANEKNLHEKLQKDKNLCNV